MTTTLKSSSDGTQATIQVNGVDRLIVDNAGKLTVASLDNSVGNVIKPSHFTGSNVSLSANGYQKLPGGLIMQWGTVSQIAHSNSGFTATVTLPLAFPNAIFSLSGNLRLHEVLAGAAPVNLDVINLSQISITLDFAVGNEGNVSRTVYWIAIGH